jgi:anti-anti-sigma factor
MKIDRQSCGTVEVFTPIGALVDEDAARFAAFLTERVKAANHRFVVDLHEVPYMDSDALEGLGSAAAAMEERSLRMRLVGVTPTCREIFELTGLSSKLEFFEDAQDAVRSFL